MSYPNNTTPTPQPGQQQPITFPYGTYHPPPGAYGQAHPQAPGVTAYPAMNHTWPPAGVSGVSGYGTWAGYTYSYAPGTQQQHLQPGSHATRPLVQTTGVPPVGSTGSATPAPATPRTTTFSAYTPHYNRESVAAAAGSGGASGRGSRKQANFKGMFSKERK